MSFYWWVLRMEHLCFQHCNSLDFRFPLAMADCKTSIWMPHDFSCLTCHRCRSASFVIRIPWHCMVFSNFEFHSSHCPMFFPLCCPAKFYYFGSCSSSSRMSKCLSLLGASTRWSCFVRFGLFHHMGFGSWWIPRWVRRDHVRCSQFWFCLPRISTVIQLAIVYQGPPRCSHLPL